MKQDNNNKGSVFIEAVILLPLVLIILFATIWGGRLMYTWAGLNYVTSTMAMDIAINGKTPDNPGDFVIEGLRQWTPKNENIEDIEVEISNASECPSCPQEKEDNILFWTPKAGSFEWKENITLAVIYPYKIDVPLLSFLGDGKNYIYIKGQATAKSEVP